MDPRVTTGVLKEPNPSLTTAGGVDASIGLFVEQMRSMAPREKHKYLTGLKVFATMVSITLAGFLMLLDSSIVFTISRRTRSPFLDSVVGPADHVKAVPRITSEFQSLNDVGWYGNAYFVSR